MKMPGMTATAADSILDWIDPDENPRANGGEAAYYASKNLPYSPRNAVPDLPRRNPARCAYINALATLWIGRNLPTTPIRFRRKKNRLGGSLTSIGGLSPQQSSNSESVPWKELADRLQRRKSVDPTRQARRPQRGELAVPLSRAGTRVGADLAKFVINSIGNMVHSSNGGYKRR